MAGQLGKLGLGGRYGLAASLDYGTNDGVATVASMAGLYFRF